MNLGLIFTKAAGAVKSVAGGGLVLAKKHAPELMIAGGLAGFVVTIVETVRATNKTNDILDHKEIRVTKFETERRLNEENYSEADYRMDISSINKQTRWQLFKAWAPVATSGAASVILILGGYRVLNGRYVATAAAYKMLEEGFERYRNNVIEEFGKDVDFRMENGIKADELEAARKEREENAIIRQENKGKKTGKKAPKTAYQEINRRIFDCNSSERWQRYWLPDQVIDFIKYVEKQLQDRVDMYGIAVLNDAFDILGMPRTAEGAVVGWVKRPLCRHNRKGERVSLGFANDEMPESEIRRVLSTTKNEDIWVRLMPNTDGVVYQEYETKYSDR